ncbi:hypothetical protein FRC08_004899 [Ceratobasidium sp. 394]|nr:hypothetical protein FRC08_004899 [Ceratobasidium sp. 394]
MPRSIYNLKYTLQNMAWGTLFPAMSLIMIIGIEYSIISPIICFGQPEAGDTGGLFFPKVIQDVFVGFYIRQICMAVLFFLALDQNNSPSAIPQGALLTLAPIK